MEDEISIFHLILESRHFTLSLLNVLKFWTCCLVLLSFLQLIPLLLTLPAFLTLGQVIWMTFLFVPLLSLSLMGTKKDPNLMNISTGKNVVNVSADATRFAAWCYGTRFLPALVILVLAHVMTVAHVLTPEDVCVARNRTLVHVDENTTELVAYDCLDVPANASELSYDDEWLEGAMLYPQVLNFVFVFLYLAVISVSFVSRTHQLWQKRNVAHNPLFLVVVTSLTTFLLFYAAVSIAFPMEEGVTVPPVHVWATWLAGLVLVLGVNELVKRQEIKVEVRHQKRERLEFGTKLGMNSPF